MKIALISPYIAPSFVSKKYIAKNKLEDKIIVLGWAIIEMLWSLYNDALALVVPSLWPENNPLVALEALSVGTPVIGTDAGGLGEIIRKMDKNMILKGDGLEEAIMNLENKNIYSKEKIKEVYNQWYSPEVYMEKYYEILNNPYEIYE